MSDADWKNYPGYQKLRLWLYSNYDHSIFRRTFILLAFAVPAFGANLAAQYLAAVLLPPDEFGIFYLATTLVYVLFSTAFVLNLFLTRHLILVGQTNGTVAIAHQMKRIERMFVGWGAALALTVFAILWIFANGIGVTSWIVLIMVVLDVYTSYIADLGRIHSLSTRRTLSLGIYTLAWMSLRALLGTLCIIFFGTVWSALLGGTAGSVLVYAAFKLLTRSPLSEAADTSSIPKLPSALDFLPLLIGYGLTMGVAQLDIMVGYFVLPAPELSVYSASSVYPKAVLVVILPLLQVLFSMMVDDGKLHRDVQKLFIKSGVVIFALAGGGAGFFWLFSTLLCGGEWGLKYCDRSSQNVLLLSVVPLAMTRFFVLLQIARGRNYIAWWLVLPALVFLMLELSGHRQVDTIVREFTTFAGFAFVFMVCVSWWPSWHIIWKKLK